VHDADAAAVLVACVVLAIAAVVVVVHELLDSVVPTSEMHRIYILHMTYSLIVISLESLNHKLVSIPEIKDQTCG